MQNDLFAMPARAPSVFFAVQPADGDQTVLDEALCTHAPRFGQPKPVAAAKRHVTMLFLGEPLEEQLPALLEGAQRAGQALRAQSFVLTLDQLAVFGRNSLVLAAAQTPPAAADLEAQLRRQATLHRLQLAKPPKFHPHLTLAHTHDGKRSAAEAIPPVRLSFNEVVLLRGGNPEAYEVLGRWPLSH
ncbi:MAG: 2'-5' RNA ligase family protein [Pseudoxanthomonas sp.]